MINDRKNKPKIGERSGDKKSLLAIVGCRTRRAARQAMAVAKPISRTSREQEREKRVMVRCIFCVPKILAFK